jgi:RimJ/RimL family protein N-acetyltransferase
MSQSDWPQDDFTLEMNIKDLKEHEEEHNDRIAFTYTVVDPTGSICLGCVYISPPEEGTMNGDYVAILRFWVRQSYLNKDLDKRLLQVLIKWFREEWAFSQTVLTVAKDDERQNQIAKGLGLQSIHVHETTWSDYLIC